MGRATKKSGTPDDQQFQLFVELPSGGKLERTAADSGRRFLTGDPNAIVVGTTPLKQYLRESGQLQPLTIGELLDQQDWSEFEARYAATGRPPYAPRLMLGLILYGVMRGNHSLRELERLARLDLGCMWLTGGIAPDHTNIGRFIVLHEQSLTSSFFESLTRHVLKVTGSCGERLAGDGTVIEAACSHYKRLKEEAVRERKKKADDALEAAPDDAAVQREHEVSTQCEQEFERRAKARKRSGRSTESLSICGSEPEAVVQRLKRTKGVAASYKPSVMANGDRIITAVAVDPSNELAAVVPLLEQSAKVLGQQPDEVLFDAGYFDDGVIAATLERDISLLCPEGQNPGTTKQGKVFPKSQFEYQSVTDSYRCPAGQTLIYLTTHAATAGKPAQRMYGGADCGQCPLRPQCTSQEQRKIARLPQDTQRDALREVMRQPGVRKVFGKRKAMVEPVFSHLRTIQGLQRFRRRGLKAVACEFALHAMAYNLSRAVALLRAFYRYFSGVTGLYYREFARNLGNLGRVWARTDNLEELPA